MSLAPHFVAALLALIFAISSASAATVALHPGSGPPTTSVRVDGTGFAANALIDVYFGTTHMCLTFASGAGAATCTFKVPRTTQPQKVWISAVQRSTLTGAQKAFTVRTDWPQYHGVNAAQTGRNPFENTLNSANVVDLGLLWRANLGALGTYATPVVYRGRVFIKGLDGKLYGFNAETGARAAGFPKTLGATGGYGSAAAGNGNIYVGTAGSDHKLYAFNAETGAAVTGFPKQLDGPVESTPATALGNVYVVTYSSTGKLYAFNATTGVRVPGFPKNLGNTNFSTPAVAAGRVYVNNVNVNFGMLAFDARTGAAIGDAGFGNIRGGPAIAGGVVYYANEQGYLISQGLNLDEDYGFTDDFLVPQLHSSPAVGHGLIIRGSNDGSLYAFERPLNFTSPPRWATPLRGGFPVNGSPVIANDLVFANSAGSLNAVSLSSGVRLWSWKVSSGAFASPAVANGIVYLGSSAGLYAFSVDGIAPSSRLRDGALSVRPALSDLRPNPSLKASRRRVE